MEVKKKLSSSVSVLISSILVLLFLPESSFRVLSMYVRHYGLSRNIFKYLRHLPGDEVIMMLIYILLIVIIAVSLIKIIVLTAKIGINRSGVSAAVSSSGHASRPSPRHVTEEAINCRHSTGRAKYLEQIEGYLKNGLIDRSEYNILKNRYEKLDIPDDYHG